MLSRISRVSSVGGVGGFSVGGSFKRGDFRLDLDSATDASVSSSSLGSVVVTLFLLTAASFGRGGILTFTDLGLLSDQR